MSKFKKVFAFFMVFAMAFAVALPAFAQTVGTAAEGKGSITIDNAAKGETYKLYKLFDATNNAAGTSIAYTGEIPNGLGDYFEKDSAGNITVKASAKDNQGQLVEAAVTALKNWANASGRPIAAQAESDGTDLVFNGLDYGYYVITSTQDSGKAISVDSTNPNATVIDKNTTTVVKQLTKTVDDPDVFIGQTVTYTVKFGTANYINEDQVIKYEISDDFANGSLSNINVTKIYVDEDGDLETTNDQEVLNTQQFVDKKITVNWAENGTKGKSLYKNGATLVIVYTGVVTDTAIIDGNGNKNTVTVKPIIDSTTTTPDPEQYTADETIYTYAVAIQKVDQSGNNLAGAKFQLPFYVKSTADPADGAYIYAGTTSGEGLVNELTTPDSGLIIIKGVQSGEYSFTETEAPAGYNKLTASVTAEAKKTGQSTTSTTTYLDAEGNIVKQESESTNTVSVSIDKIAATPIVVVNKTGAEMPSTGGIGTTIFYIVGGGMVAAAVIFLLTKRRMAGQE